jgi:thioredoxin reductase (NADPH)
MNAFPLHDVVIVGGGAAGLSAAVTLGRSLRSVVVLDAGEPRNAPAAGVHNVLGREGLSPGSLLALGRNEAEAYGVEVRSGRAVAARRSDGGFEVDLAGGGSVRGRRLLLATGLVDELPDLPGLAEHWGTRVLHCPYCHGWEVRGRRIGILGAGERSVHQALLFRQLSPFVTLFQNDVTDPDAAGWEQLAALGIRVVAGRVARLRGAGGSLDAVELEDGHAFRVDALAVAPRFVARDGLYRQLGGTPEENPAGRFVAADALGRTGIAGVFAAGNTSDMSAGVAAAAASGVVTAGGINADLIAEDASAAAHERAMPFSAAAEASNAARVLGGHRHGLDLPAHSH